MMASRDECSLGGALSRRRFRRSSRTRSEHRDAWAKVVKRFVMNRTKLKIHPEERDAWTKLVQEGRDE